MKQTIRVEIFESAVTRDCTLTVYKSKWTNDSQGISITSHDEIHRETFDTIDSALKKAVHVNYEYEQRMDNQTGGSDE